MVMASTAFGQGEIVELVNYFAGMVTLVAWIVLIAMFAVVGTAWVIGRIRRQAPNP
jgi:hypothetical protein